ncbi:MAG TPA: hypothetical protein VKX28_01395 [Xanthobacteraceae bacterium]|jgi:hypothetical protein|nr:hypothetical protein [Xanthobacteraceae bacterium]
MTRLGKTLIGAALGGGVLAFSGMTASAAIVCSEDVCWHTHTTYEYPEGAHVIVHPDSWRWGPREHFTFREHEGRGYWRGERWIEW